MRSNNEYLWRPHNSTNATFMFLRSLPFYENKICCAFGRESIELPYFCFNKPYFYYRIFPDRRRPLLMITQCFNKLCGFFLQLRFFIHYLCHRHILSSPLYYEASLGRLKRELLHFIDGLCEIGKEHYFTVGYCHSYYTIQHQCICTSVKRSEFLIWNEKKASRRFFPFPNHKFTVFNQFYWFPLSSSHERSDYVTIEKLFKTMCAENTLIHTNSMLKR